MSQPTEANNELRWEDVIELADKLVEIVSEHPALVSARAIAFLAASDLSARSMTRADFASNYAHFVERVKIVGLRMVDEMEANPPTLDELKGVGGVQ